MKKVLFACLSTSILAISCSKDDSAPVNPAEQKYMTITTNSQWIYDVIDNPGPGQTAVIDTVTATSTDTTINLSGSARVYRIFRHSGGASDYYNITNNDYYRFQQVDLNGTPLKIEDLYLKDNQPALTNWAQVVNITIPGFPTAIPLTITNSITDKGISKTVNGTVYTDVIGIKTEITSSLLPAGTIVTDIKSYYARKFGLIEGNYKVQISAASVDINTNTFLKSATIQ